ncbi:hypothetical protein DVH05_027387 [Phytophthora capsici]|nr:hypothetical protein DVH05_027387 [Phytophthora capsici]
MCDEVLALKQFLQGMLLADLDEGGEISSPTSGKEVIRNDKLLELMGVAVSETSSSADCYSLDDERPAAVAPLHILSPQLREQENTCQPGHDLELPLEVPDCVDAVELTDEGEAEVVEDEDFQKESDLSRGYTNKTSAALLRRSGTFEPDFQARMKQFLLKNQQKKERIRQSLRVEEEPDVNPMPRINERSKSIPRNVSHLIAWNYEKENKLSRLRDVEAAKQEAICVGKPSISKRSVSIFSKRKDDVAQCKVEDRLHLLGLIYQYQQEERKRAEERRESPGLQPRLAPHSANAQRWRQFSVHERLYQLSKTSPNTMKENGRDICQRKAAARRRRSSNNRDLVNTAQRLHALDKKYKQKHQLLGEERKQYFDNLRTAPKMSARSRKLAARRKKNHAPKSPVRCGCCGGKEDNEGKCGCTVEPRVNQKHAADIYERQVRWKNANEAKHTQQKQLQDTLTMIECTFRNPFYQEAWNTLDHKPTDKGSKEKQTNDAFFERCMMWAEKRDQQVALERKTFQQQQLKECTFKPRVIARTPKYLSRQSNQQDETACSQNQIPIPTNFPDCSTTTSPERQDLTTEELVTRLYSTLDLQELAGELSPEYNSIGSDDEGVHGFPKYTFTDLGEFAGR